MRDNTLVADWLDEYDYLVEPMWEAGFDRNARSACWEAVEGVEQ